MVAEKISQSAWNARKLQLGSKVHVNVQIVFLDSFESYLTMH